jgi:two-component system chemotaxis family response regulator WspR
VLYIDVDHFKSYNDAYGHGRGDETLAMIAKVLARNAAREVDRVCRLGGEEFAYLLPATDLRGAFNVADRARRGVEALGLPHPQEDFVSISIGVGTIRPTASDRAKQFLERVDAALYRAKRMGRNRVEFVSEEDGTIRTG